MSKTLERVTWSDPLGRLWQGGIIEARKDCLVVKPNSCPHRRVLVRHSDAKREQTK